MRKLGAPQDARDLAAKTLRDIRRRSREWRIGGYHGRMTDYHDARELIWNQAPFVETINDMRRYVFAGNILHLQHEGIALIRANGYRPSDTQWGAF